MSEKCHMRIQLIIPGFENGGQRLEGTQLFLEAGNPPAPPPPHFIASKKSRVSIQNFNKLNSTHNLDWQEPHSPLHSPQRNTAYQYFHFILVRPILNCKVINLYCFKPLYYMVISNSSNRKH